MKAPRPINHPDNQRLIEQHTPLVKKIAFKMAQGLSANVEYDDLVQDGMMGLIDVILRATKATAGAEFEHYIAQRARGAMLDGLRANDPGSRQIRQDMRKAELAIQRLGHVLGRAPSEGEVATALDLPLPEYQRILQEAHGYVLISLDDLGDEDSPASYLELCATSNADPLVALQRTALRQALGEAIKKLPKQEMSVLNFYYEEDMRMHEIGKALGLSEARVSQIHAQAIALLRAAFVGGEQTVSLLKPRRKAR
jgi:RNA polymerase sigma factor for flagellar operon FliA